MFAKFNSDISLRRQKPQSKRRNDETERLRDDETEKRRDEETEKRRDDEIFSQFLRLFVSSSCFTYFVRAVRAMKPIRRR